MTQLSVVFYILKSSLSGINVDTLNYEFCGESRFSRLILAIYFCELLLPLCGNGTSDAVFTKANIGNSIFWRPFPDLENCLSVKLSFFQCCEKLSFVLGVHGSFSG